MNASDKSRDDLIERVKKILKRTEEAGCTQAEAEAAMAKASRLMAEHNLSIDEVERDGGPEEGFVEGTGHESGRWDIEYSLACGIIREFFFCESIKYRSVVGRRQKVRLVFFGKPTNVETARWAFKALIDAFDRLWSEFRKANIVERSERRLFVAGVARGFSDRMRDERRALEIEREITEGKAGTALALVGIAQQVAMAFKEAHADMKAAKPLSPLKGQQSTLQAGYEAGRRLNLARPLEGADAGRKGLPQQ